MRCENFWRTGVLSQNILKAIRPSTKLYFENNKVKKEHRCHSIKNKIIIIKNTSKQTNEEQSLLYQLYRKRSISQSQPSEK